MLQGKTNRAGASSSFALSAAQGKLHTPPPAYPGAPREELPGLGNRASIWLWHHPCLLHMGEDMGVLAPSATTLLSPGQPRDPAAPFHSSRHPRWLTVRTKAGQR